MTTPDVREAEPTLLNPRGAAVIAEAVVAALHAAGRLREHVVTALTDTEVEELLAPHPLDHLWGSALDASRSRDFRGGDEDGVLDEDAYLRYRRRALDKAYADVLDGLAGRLLPEGGTDHVWPRDVAEGVAEGRRQAAADIRNEAAKIATRAEAEAGVATGVADDHPFLLACEFAARLAEGSP